MSNANECVYAETYKGVEIQVFTDYDAESPKGWADDNLIMLGFNDRYFFVEHKDISHEEAREALRVQKHELRKKYHLFPVRGYVHSGVSLSLDNEKYPFNDSWDSMWIGVVLVARSEFKTKQEAKKSAMSLVESWNDSLSGNVWQYTVGKNGHIASCGGYYGNFKENGMLDDARAEVTAWLKDNKPKQGIDCPLCGVFIKYEMVNGVHTWNCPECPFKAIEQY